MSEVWVEHPELGPGSREKVLRAALGAYHSRGYEVCDDQDDPVDPDVAEAQAAAADHHEDDVDHDVEHETPAEDVAPVSNDDDPEES